MSIRSPLHTLSELRLKLRSKHTKASHSPWMFLIHLGLFFCFFIAGTELFYRWVMPARQSPLPSYESVFKLRNFDHQKTPSGFFSSGRWIQQRSHWTINSWGWNSSVEYCSDAERNGQSVVVFSGDSQIEGFYVNEDEHMAHVFTQIDRVKNPQTFSIGYSMASSGFTLATYPTLARYLKHHGIKPKALVLLANPGDFKGISPLWGAPYRSQFPTYQITPFPDFSITPAPIYPYTSTSLRRFLRKSALVRYFVFNVRLNPFGFAQSRRDLALEKRKDLPKVKSNLSINTRSKQQWRSLSEEELVNTPEAKATFEFLVKEIHHILPKTPLIFLGDAPRGEIKHSIKKNKEIDSSSLPRFALSRFIEKQCSTLKLCTFFDPTDLFTQALKTGEQVDFKHNPHWNAYTHAQIAHALHLIINQIE